MSKLRLQSLPATVILMLVAAAGFAQQLQIPEPQGLVNDFAGKLTNSTKQNLEHLLRVFGNRSDIDLTVVTVPFEYLAEQPIESYSLEMGRRWGVGRKEGALILLIAIKAKGADGTYGGATRLEVSRKLEKDMPNEEAGELIRRMRSDLRQGRFDEALTQGVQTIIARLAEKRNISIEDLDAGNAARTNQQNGVRVESGTPLATYQPPSPAPSNAVNNQSPQNNSWSFSTVLIFIVGLPLLIISVVAMAVLRAMSKLNNPANRSSNPSRLFFARDAQARGRDYSSTTPAASDSPSFSGFSETSSSSSFSDSSSSSWSDSSSFSSSDSSSSSSSDFGGSGSTDSW